MTENVDLRLAYTPIKKTRRVLALHCGIGVHLGKMDENVFLVAFRLTTAAVALLSMFVLSYASVT